MKNSLIYLIGMPSSGKSTFGRIAAEKLNYGFLDLDSLIEEDNNSTIPQIFESKGENFFRKEEQKALQFTFNLQKTIIATGGGTPCFFDNLEKMKQNGIVYFLNVEIETLAKRTFEAQKIQQDNRPLFKDASSFEELYQLISQKWNDRKTFYQKANFEVKNNNLEEFFEKIELEKNKKIKKIIALFITFSILFGGYLLLMKFTTENIFSYKILEPIFVALGVTIIVYLFFGRKK